VLSWIAGVLVTAAALVLWPFATWLLLAIWTAIFARRLQLPLSRTLGGRPRVAAAITVVLLALVFVPVCLVLASLVADAIDLVTRLLATDRAQAVVQQLVAPGDHERIGAALGQGGRAWALAQQIAGTAARIVIGIVVLVAGVYAMLIDGERWYRWAEEHAPISRAAMRRLAGAFVETGRGMFIGILGAGVAQALVATILYVVLDVPQPFALGLLTLIGSLVPAIGTALVWVPVAIGLAVTGETTQAIILAIGGVAVIGTIDNLVRPYLARRGQLQLPTYVVLVAMFGGIELLGARGLLLGPLVVRLAKEALELRREANA